MKRGILFGFGSEIGCKLVELTLNSKSIVIDTVVNNSHGSTEDNLNSIKAKLIFSNPQLLSRIKLDYENNFLLIDNKKIKCIFLNIEEFLSSSENISKKYDFGILATNKNDIANSDLINQLLYSCKKLFGVAESKNHNSIYFPLLNVKSKRLNFKLFDNSEFDYFALGSCQSIGWTSTLSLIVNWLDKVDINQQLKIISSQVDIVHPDTPQGRFGTKSFMPREQDARNNFRPSFSQVKMSMLRAIPEAVNFSPISLRTCIEPPGFQISRFLIELCDNEFQKENFNFQSLNSYIKEYSFNNPEILNFSDESYGSKAFSQLKTSSTILSSKDYLSFEKIIDKNNYSVYQIITQSYVHNTLGYSNSIIRSIEQALSADSNTLCFFENI